MFVHPQPDVDSEGSWRKLTHSWQQCSLDDNFARSVEHVERPLTVRRGLLCYYLTLISPGFHVLVVRAADLIFTI